MAFRSGFFSNSRWGIPAACSAAVAFVRPSHAQEGEICAPSFVPGSSTIIVDAGSGYSRSIVFRTQQTDGLPIIAERVSIHAGGRNIMKVIQNDETDAFAEAIEDIRAAEQLASSTAKVPVIVGATAGVRHALETGKIKPDQITRFREKLAEHDIDFRVLTGSEEAELEMKGAEFCFRKAYPDVAGPLGIISAGGMSAQVVNSKVSYSLPFQLKEQNKRLLLAATTNEDVRFLREEIEKVIPQYFSECTSRVHPSAEGKLESKVFLALEMLAWVGELAGLADQLLSVEEARLRLEAFVLGHKVAMCRTRYEARRGWDRHINASIITALEAIAILDMLDPSSMVLFKTVYNLGTTTLEPTWCLAMYLALKKCI